MLLNVTDLSKSFPGETGPVVVLDAVSFSLAAGQSLALTGESGSGKSTLLHLIAGLEEADGGSIALDGAETTGLGDTARAALRRGRIAIVFQQFNLIPSLNVADNIAFQARLAGRHDPDWTAHLTASLGLADQVGKYPELLSGGQQQRVAIGRALAARPALVLADEPTGNLDEASSDTVVDLMGSLVTEARSALLLVTHSERLAGRLSQRMHLSKGRLA